MGMWGPAFLEHGDDAALPGYPRLWSAVKQLGGLPPIGPGHKVTGNPKASLPLAPLAAVVSFPEFAKFNVCRHGSLAMRST